MNIFENLLEGSKASCNNLFSILKEFIPNLLFFGLSVRETEKIVRDVFNANLELYFSNCLSLNENENSKNMIKSEIIKEKEKIKYLVSMIIVYKNSSKLRLIIPDISFEFDKDDTNITLKIEKEKEKEIKENLSVIDESEEEKDKREDMEINTIIDNVSLFT